MLTQEDYDNLDYVQSLTDEEFDEWMTELSQADRDYVEHILHVRNIEASVELAGQEAKIEPIPLPASTMYFEGNYTFH